MTQAIDPIDLAPGVKIIKDVLDMPGVDTPEGIIGPVLFGQGMRTQYVDMPPHSYFDEHPHPTQSLAFTVRGRWVMCAEGNRILMEPGSMYWFGPNVPTGFEVPFDERAYLLVFKSDGDDQTPAEMLAFVDSVVRPKMEAMLDEGEIFDMRALPEDHPARQFAHEVNPEQY